MSDPLLADDESPLICRCEYYDLDVVDENVNREDFSQYCVLHLNIRSLRTKLDELRILISQIEKRFTAVNFILICETHLTDVTVSYVNIEGYNFEYKNRDGLGGGVAIFIKEGIKYRRRDDLAVNVNKEFESLVIETQQGNNNSKRIILAEVYRVPNCKEKNSIENFKLLLNKLNQTNHTVILGTDQNFDLLKINSNTNVSDLYTEFLSHGLVPTIDIPTRVTHSSATLIDNIYVKLPVQATKSAVIYNDISDHFPVVTFLPMSNSNKIKYISKTHRPMSESNIENMLLLLREENWQILEFGSLDNAYNVFLSRLNAIIEQCAPLKTIIIPPSKVRKEPWFTKGLMQSAKKKARLYRKSLNKQKSDPSYTAYISYRNMYNKLKREAKQRYYRDMFTRYTYDMRRTWSTINKLIRKERIKTNITHTITANSNEMEDPIEIANAFANYFANIGNERAAQITATSTSPREYLSDINHPTTLFLVPTEPAEISKVISSFKSKSTLDPENLSTSLVKKLKCGLLVPLVLLINRSFAEGNFPAQLKKTKVVPVPKTRDSSTLDNYRPISLLPIFSKIFEKVFCLRLLKFLNEQNILMDHQYGFRENRSTTDAVLDLTTTILSGLNNKQSTVAVFLDLSKAFDTINHEVLLDKLHIYGVRGNALNWIKNYLTNRNLRVIWNNCESETHLLQGFGVPQGSVIGPLLFNIYVNDLHRSLNHCRIIQYADDTTLIRTGSITKAIINELNQDLENVTVWFRSNSLSLNFSKTKYSIYERRKKNEAMHPDLKMENKPLERVSTIKFLGIFVDEKLLWAEHINYVKEKLARGLFALRSLRNYVPQNVLKSIYYTLMHPFLEYGCVLWGDAHRKRLKPLITLQKRAVRSITNSAWDSPTAPHFRSLNILRLQDIYKLNVVSSMYRVSIFNISNSIRSIFSKLESNHSHNTRHNMEWRVPFISLDIARRSLLYNGVKEWKNVPIEAKNALNVKLFKKHMKKFYVSSY